jgi:hypothetical protein
MNARGIQKYKDKIAVILFAFFAAGIASGCDPSDDQDFDGLSDKWEQNNQRLGINPRRADMILMPVLRPGMARAEVTDTLDKVKDFYGRMPNRNLDGSTGIHISIVWGNELEESDRNKPYYELRTKGMKREWIGKAHGILIEPGRGGGGQANGVDWAGVSNNWHAIAHELGHQLGLGHTPNNGPQSPFYTSIMNYDYTYSFNGDPDAVQFSQGRFASLRLDEQNLDENLPFAAEDLQFLTAGRGPYDFKIQAIDRRSSQIDFNHNGIFGERGVRADINYGYAVSVKDLRRFSQSVGAVALSTWGSGLVVITQVPYAPIDWKTYTGDGLTRQWPGSLKYQIMQGSNVGAARDLGLRNVAGEPFAVEYNGKLYVSYPTTTGYAVSSFVGGSNSRLSLERTVEQESVAPVTPVLVVTGANDPLQLLLWHADTKLVSSRPVTVSASALDLGPSTLLRRGDAHIGDPVRSLGPVAGAWSPKTNRLLLVTSSTDSSRLGALDLTMFGADESHWQLIVEEPVVRRQWGPATRHRPAIVFHDGITPGTEGDIYIYQLRLTDRGGSQVMDMAHRIPTTSGEPYWIHRIMVNEWTVTRSGPSAIRYGADIAWAWRLFEGFRNLENTIEVNLASSGATETPTADFDDVGFIATQGLRRVVTARP